MLPAPYAALRDDLRAILPDDRVYTDPLRTLAYGTDASFYRLTPKLVVDVLCEDEVTELLRLAQKHKTPLTFRAAGTSLSGQGVTDSVLVRLGYGWRNYRVDPDAASISLQPGIIGADANKILAPLGRKIGPDPASIDSCMIGGIAANNASGMCCGVADNSYKTLLSARLILADGTLLDTADAVSRDSFAKSHGHILEGLAALRKKVLADKDLAERIRKKFKIKNTMGYSINALVDFEDPFAILRQLMIGSEGTLGFIAEVTYKTVAELPCKASSLMLFDTIPEACRAAAILRNEPVSASELMDRASLRSVEGQPGIPADIAELGGGVCSLLVETRAATKEELKKQIARIAKSVADLNLVRPVVFTDVEKEYAALWQIRKGILPSVGAVRTAGDTCIIEDVAVPMEHLADAALTLQKLFIKHGYNEGVIFGHARDGNLHFVFNQNFGARAEVERYAAFMDEVCRSMAGDYDGSLKAEHGTGRNMAPYVEMEWGRAAYELMREIKTLLDPRGILNPGVVLNDDAHAHIKDLKPLPPAHEIIDACSECGFCEPTCPSRRLSLTPRQRITSYREIMRLSDPAHKDKLVKALEKTYTYQGKETCAADGLCAVRCPAHINTGSFIKVLRERENGALAKHASRFIRNHFRGTCVGASVLLTSVNVAHRVLGSRVIQFGSDALRVVSFGTSPAWNKAMPTGGSRPPVQEAREYTKSVVYFPSCISRNMGPDIASTDRRSEAAITVDVLTRAGFRVIFPRDVEKLCCGMAFSSKGFVEDAAAKAAELGEALLAASENGAIPVLTETSPCLLHMRETLDSRLKLYEPIEFALEHLVPALSVKKLPKKVAVHVTCSARKMGLAQKLAELARLCAETVVTPEHTECCGFAGDRGFTHPELNEAALRELRIQVSGCDAGYSTSRTCQIGLTLHGGIPYMSILALLDEASRQ
ncbi:FAD-binding oxidoreductase [Desulfovibrio sp. OttesenSCG-928-O18]|nr:FAD-binding oxidoreductase [Desulfovibrio sp. OttesenSCG-928-O18]